MWPASCSEASTFGMRRSEASSRMESCELTRLFCRQGCDRLLFRRQWSRQRDLFHNVDTGAAQQFGHDRTIEPGKVELHSHRLLLLVERNFTNPVDPTSFAQRNHGRLG